ncbi:response regulator [Candidatus Latescibacterota bacterium]
MVEDDEEICNLLDRLLSETHTVKVAGDGREALDRFGRGQYDAVLIDLGMPGMAGDQVAARMRQLDPSVATVLITGWDARGRILVILVIMTKIWYDYTGPPSGQNSQGKTSY